MNNKFLSLTVVSLLALTTTFGSFSALSAENISKTSVAATSGNGTVKNALSDIDFNSGFSELKTGDNGNKYLVAEWARVLLGKRRSGFFGRRCDCCFL